MSTNNQLIITKSKRHKNSLFQVHENLCVDNEFKPNQSNLLKKFKTLLEAIKFSNKYCRENMVEYNTYIDNSCLEKEKEK